MKRGRGNTIGCETTTSESINMAHVLMLLSQTGTGNTDLVQYYPANDQERVFECKTCKRRFPSFQALGGHRASHKKPRTSPEDCTDQASSTAAALVKPKLHECSICGLEFNIGQALGGHMRRHRQIGHTEGFSVHNGGILDHVNKSCAENSGNSSGFFHVEMKMAPLMTDQGETATSCTKDREPVTLNLFV